MTQHYKVCTWGLLALLLLMQQAHAWGREDIGRQGWDSPHGAQWGTTHYHYYQGPHGQNGRCSSWNWRGERHVRCD